MALGSSDKNLKKIMKEQLTFENGYQNFSSVLWSCCSPVYIPQRNPFIAEIINPTFWYD